jgi:hypothetical protein
MSRNTVSLADPAPYQGEPVALEPTVRDATGAVVDITGWAIQWRLSKANPAVAQENLLTIDATVPDDGTTGVFTVAVPLTATQRAAGPYVHEVRRIDAGFEQTLARSAFTVRDSAFWIG